MKITTARLSGVLFLLGATAAPLAFAQDVCDPPGITILEDPAGDATGGQPAYDILKLSIAEPSGIGTDRLMFTLKMASLETVPADTYWNVQFNVGSTTYVVRMTTFAPASPANPGFEYFQGTWNTTTVGAAAADPGSSFNTDGTITIVVPRSGVGSPAVGTDLTSFLVRIAINAGGVLLTPDNMPDSLAPAGNYTIAGNCGAGPPVVEDVCVAPGLSTLDDKSGDIFVAAGQTSNKAWDLRKLSISQPYYDTGDYKIVFHLKVEDLAVIPQNTIWPVNFCSPAFACVNPDVNTQAYGPDNQYYTVRMVGPGADNAGTAPIFQILQPTATSTSAATRTKIAADAESKFTPDGMITLVAKATDIGLNPANAGIEKLSKFHSRVLVGADAGRQTTPDNMPDDLVGAGEFSTVPLSQCAPNAAPTATLSANPNPPVGSVPFDVEFTVTGADTDGDALDWSLNFGDGPTPDEQPLVGGPLKIPHTYQEAGTYTAKLTVTDTKGAATAAELTVEVSGPPVAHPVATPTTVDEGDTVTLDGLTSNDGNAGALSYTWSPQQSTPAVTLNPPGANAPVVTFTAPDVCTTTDLRFRLTVANSAGTDSEDVLVAVNNINQPPVANAGGNRTVNRGDSIALDGGGSSDPDTCQTLTYMWEQLAGDSVAHGGVTSPKLEFHVPDTMPAQLLYFRLTVTDSEGAKDVDNIIVTVSAAPTGVTKILGGALPLSSLLVLGLLGAIRHRRQITPRYLR